MLCLIKAGNAKIDGDSTSAAAMADQDRRKESRCSTPSLVVDSESEDWEYEESYFLRTYQPLSNLPTPPPSSRGSTAASDCHAECLLEEGEALDPTLLGKSCLAVYPNSPPPPLSS